MTPFFSTRFPLLSRKFHHTQRSRYFSCTIVRVLVKISENQNICSSTLLNLFDEKKQQQQYLLYYLKPVDPTRATFMMVIVEFSVDITATDFFLEIKRHA